MAREAARRLGLATAAAAVAALAVAVPAAGARPLTVAAYYYTWYGPGGMHWDKGYVRGRLEAPQRPALGEYDSRDPAVVASHYAWAQHYGVDVFVASWWGPGGYDDVTLRDHVLPSPARGPTRVAILYESIRRLGLDADNRIHLDAEAIAAMVADFDYLARTYLSRPGYYRIGGRPVVVLYVSRIYRGAVADAVRAVRRHVLRRHGLRLFLVGDEVDWDIGPSRARIRLFDAITGYTPYSRTQPAGLSDAAFVARVDARFRAFRRAAARERVAFVPGVIPGFNDRGVRPEAGNYVLPHRQALFGRFLALAGRTLDPRLRLMTVTSWNEWHEDTQIEPTGPAAMSAGPPELTDGHGYEAYGFGLLETLRRFRLALAG